MIRLRQRRLAISDELRALCVPIEPSPSLVNTPVGLGESAIRALQQCNPLRLPADKYAMWQDMIVNFDPKQAVGP